jgi:hypothetical protein
MKQFLVSSFLFFILINVTDNIHAQKREKKNLVYVDRQGVLRWTKDNTEASFFGINYTVPFAYGYRSHKALGIDIEKAIEQDVYHFARLGLDAFRVHVWDVEISDSLGNLLENEHLRLFDYLISKLKERNIRILLTPIAFWGNGYPEKDEKTNGFSYVYGKGNSVVLEAPIKAQENYLYQILKHVNPYTKLTYGNDPDIIALEINNEPHHSGPKQKVTEYINRMVAAVKSSGWNKPIIYNISESPSYADAVAKANIDGVSFQWYPTGLVANHMLKGNYLPHVDRYNIPFGDTIPQFAGKTRMVYEFDAGDVLQSNMYPAIARSFRSAGFQWVTQFAYDPMATAYANTEYQTHYLNLAYTPSKAISLMIASKVFHKLPRLKNYGHYPADTLFDVFRVSYKESLSEMNSEQEFYYSNSTSTKPIRISWLQHIAGVGSSPVVQYKGYGAYFIDKVEDGIWRLEVFPDAILIRDPFEKASPKKEVTRIQWQTQTMEIRLPDLGEEFSIVGLNNGNDFHAKAEKDQFSIKPGTYLVIKKEKSANEKSYSKTGTIGMNEFVAPVQINTEPYIMHIPFNEVSAGNKFTLKTKIVGVDSTDKIVVEIRNSSGKWRTIPMQRSTSYDFEAEVPPDIVTPGVLNYRIIIENKNHDFISFPGNYKGNPYAWDYFYNDTWQTFVAPTEGALEIFNPGNDRNNLNIYNPDWRNNSFQLITADKPGRLIFEMITNQPDVGKILGWQHYFADKMHGRESEISAFDKLVIRARTANAEELEIKLALILNDGSSFATYIKVGSGFKDFEIPLNSLKQDSALLLPRPYPGFLPLWFKSAVNSTFNLEEAEKLEISFGHNASHVPEIKPLSLQIESVWLKKS